MPRPGNRHSSIMMVPDPPRITRSSPGKRGLSLDQRGRSPGPATRGKREFRNNSPPRRNSYSSHMPMPENRRSRSPMERRVPKGGPLPREYPSSSKRKGPEMSPPPKRRGKGERLPEGSVLRQPDPKLRRSKSPVVRDRSSVVRDRSSRSRPFDVMSDLPPGNSKFSSKGGPVGDPGPSGDRFRGGADYEEDKELERPIFRGPDDRPGGYNINELKSITVQILRKQLLVNDEQNINRAIVNLEEVTPVRRHDEGTRPIFAREELMRQDRAPPVEQRRIVDTHVALTCSPPGRERSRSIGPSRSSSKQYYPSERDRERDHSPYEYRRHSSREYVDSADKRGSRYESSGDDLRRELHRRRDDSHYPSAESRSDKPNYERHKETDRHDERDRDRERDRDSHRPRHVTPPPSSSSRRPHSQERRRGSPGPSSKMSRPREHWEEKERDREGDRKRRARSRERDDEWKGDASGSSRRRSSAERFTEERSATVYTKPDMSYDHLQEFYGGEEFPVVAGTWLPRGRGGMAMRRGMPPPQRGVFRGSIRRPFRGGPFMGPRGPPFIPPIRGPFRPMVARGFAPRFFPFRPFFM